jgi:hypothetical protein
VVATEAIAKYRRKSMKMQLRNKNIQNDFINLKLLKVV